MSHQQHQSCIEACQHCAQECEHCNDACLNEPEIQALAECIRLDRDCAQICWTAAAYMSRGSLRQRYLPSLRGDLRCLCRRVREARIGALPTLRRGVPAVCGGVPPHVRRGGLNTAGTRSPALESGAAGQSKE